MCVACVCVLQAQHDQCSLDSKPFETRDLVRYLYLVEHGHSCDLTIVEFMVKQNGVQITCWCHSLYVGTQ